MLLNYWKVQLVESNDIITHQERKGIFGFWISVKAVIFIVLLLCIHQKVETLLKIEICDLLRATECDFIVFGIVGTPVSNFVSNLSPIEHIKFIRNDHTFNSLSYASPPSGFTPPHIVSPCRNKLFQKRYSCLSVPDLILKLNMLFLKQ